MRQHTPWAWLIALTLIALVVRVIGLNSGFWLDEIYSLIDSIRPPLATIVTSYHGDTQHPLYMPLAHLSITALGEHPWTVRLPALLFGVASVPMLYALGALVASRREALLAAALLAVSYHHVWFSQNARGYSMLAFWAMLATYLLIRAMRERHARWHIGFALTAALGIYTHLTMVFVLAAQALACLWLVLEKPQGIWLPRWKNLLGAFALAAMLTLLLYVPILPEVADFFLNRPSQLEGVSTPGWAFTEAFRVLKIGFGGVGWLGAAALAAGAFVFCLGLLSYLRQSRFVALLFALPALVTFAGALVARGTMYPRFFFFLAGFAVLIAVRGAMVLGQVVAERLPGSPPIGAGLGMVMVGVMIAVSAKSLPYTWRYPKQDFEGALHFVEARRAPAERIVTAGVAGYAYRELYGRPWANVNSAEDLNAIRARGAPVWLLYTLPRYLERGSPELMALLQRNCSLERTFHGTLGGGDVTVCRLPPLSL